jgi:hypothetical protein
MQLLPIALNGLESATARFEQAAAQVGGASIGSVEGTSADVVDLSAAALALTAARNDFVVTAQTLKVAEKVENQVLNLLG